MGIASAALASLEAVLAPSRRGPAITIAVVAGIALAGPADAQSRSWSASGTYENVAVTDCRDCGDDIGMMIRCQGMGAPAEVTVHWSAVENGQDGGRAPIGFSIDGRSYAYTATTTLFGQIGYTPQFLLNPGDPLIEALQGGRSARVDFAGRTTAISLSGSRAAIDIFKAHCGWNGPQAAAPARPMAGAMAQAMPAVDAAAPAADAAADVEVTVSNGLATPADMFYIDASGSPQFLYTLAPGESVVQPSRPGLELAFGVGGQEVSSYRTGPQPRQAFAIGQGGQPVYTDTPAGAGVAAAPVAPPADDDGARWSYYPGETSSRTQEHFTHSLVFGIPETDATVLSAVCAYGLGSPPDLTVQFLAGASVPPGMPVTVDLVSQAGTFTAEATADANGFPVAIARQPGGVIESWWNAFLYPGAIDIEINGRPAGRVASMSDSTDAGQFYSDCQMR